MNIRDCINIIEEGSAGTTGPFAFLYTKPFLAQVRAYLEENLSDWAEDYAKDRVLVQAIRGIVKGITQEALWEGDILVVSRVELRPASQVETKQFGSVGCFWSWGQGARVCNHDNAHDSHGEDGLVEVTFVASVKIADVNWAASIAQNLALPGEEEIRIRGTAHVHLDECHSALGYQEINQRIPVSDWDGT